MMASSTSAPRAMTSPASVIVLIVWSCAWSTSRVAVIDSGMVSRLISATRHSNRNSARMITTSRKPRMIASLRLSMAVWMKFSCWNIVASNRMLGRLGSSVLTTSSTSRVSSTVSAHGSFSTMSIRPRLVVDRAVAEQRLVVLDDVGDVARAGRSVPARPERPPPRGPRRGSAGGGTVSIGTCARSLGVTMGSTVRTLSRWFGVSMMPPGPMIEPSSCSSSPESTASAVVSMTWLRLMLRCVHRVRPDLHLQHLQPLAPQRHVGHAGHLEQPCADRPVGGHRHLDEGPRRPSSCRS